MEIRIAKLADIDRINELFWELDTQSISEQPEHFQRGERAFNYYSDLINNESSDFLLGIVDNIIIGFSLLIQKEVKGLNLLVPCKYTYIQDFIITADFRNNGYGTKLVQASHLWAQEHNSEFLRLSVMPKNELAIRFYKRNGFVAQMITMECHISNLTCVKP